MAISKSKYLSQKEIEALIIDATEQLIEKSKKGQEPYYSGKKKCHTVKTSIRIKKREDYLYFKTKLGPIHDFNIHKQESPLSVGTLSFVDLRCQGLDKIYRETKLHYKLLNRQEKD